MSLCPVYILNIQSVSFFLSGNFQFPLLPPFSGLKDALLCHRGSVPHSASLLPFLYCSHHPCFTHTFHQSTPESPQGASFSLCWQMLQVTYGGWQNVSMTRYFRDYADLCFEVSGDRVKHWFTFSDPRVSRGSFSDGETGMSPAAPHGSGIPIAVSADSGRKRLRDRPPRTRPEASRHWSVRGCTPHH